MPRGIVALQALLYYTGQHDVGCVYGNIALGGEGGGVNIKAGDIRKKMGTESVGVRRLLGRVLCKVFYCRLAGQ